MYPAHLSKGDESRVPLHRRGKSKTYERLEDLLREAGFKETRIFTPEAERIEAEAEERIKREVNATNTVNGKSSRATGLAGLLAGFVPWSDTNTTMIRKDDIRGTKSNAQSMGRAAGKQLLDNINVPETWHPDTPTPWRRPFVPTLSTFDFSSPDSSSSASSRSPPQPFGPQSRGRLKPPPERDARTALRHMSSKRKRTEHRKADGQPPMPVNWLNTVTQAVIDAGPSSGAHIGGPAQRDRLRAHKSIPQLLNESAYRNDARRTATLAHRGFIPHVRTTPGVVTPASVICHSAPGSRSSSLVRTSSTRFNGKTKGNKRGRDAIFAYVPSLGVTTVEFEHDGWAGLGVSPSTVCLESESDDDSDGGELDFARLIMPARRQHSIQSLRRHLHNHNAASNTNGSLRAGLRPLMRSRTGSSHPGLVSTSAGSSFRRRQRSDARVLGASDHSHPQDDEDLLEDSFTHDLLHSRRGSVDEAEGDGLAGWVAYGLPGLEGLLIILFLLRKRLLMKTHTKLSADELAKATQMLYETKLDGSKTLLVPFQGRIAKVDVRPTSLEKIKDDARKFPPLPSSHKPNIDRVFLRQLRAILRIAFPSLASKETFIVLLHSSFLVLRTILSVGVARLDGRIVRDLISGNGKGFLRGLGWWFIFAIPSTYTNSMLRHLQSKLALKLRTNLTRYTHDLYLSSAPALRYHRISQPGGLEGVDQYITSDIAAFCESLSALYGNVMKPTLDMFIFTAQLSRVLGVRGTVLLFANYYVTVGILRAVTPAFGRLAAVEAMLEGEYRAGMSRVGRESEEIAFYAGGARERSILWGAYLRLVKHINSIYKLRIAYEWTEDFVIKYLWSAAGYCLISIPVLFTRKRSVGVQFPMSTEGMDDAIADRTENYISSRRLLISLADAGGRLMYAYKDVLSLAGYTTRLYALLSTLHALPTAAPFTVNTDTVAVRHLDIRVPGTSAHPRRNDGASGSDESTPASINGESETDVDGLILVRDLSFELRVGAGEHLMITGTNGVGKTAIARVVAGLWAGFASTGKAEGDAELVRPSLGSSEVFVVPQRAYMVSGTLLDQVIYPHSYAQFLQAGRTEAELMEILEAAHLAYLPAREGGWIARKEWRDVLSGGEKQRMGLARAFYHKPKFAVLDECTSAVSSDVEGAMYQHAKTLGITLITISLRPSLAKYHTHMLTLHGPSSSSAAVSDDRVAIGGMDVTANIGEDKDGSWTLTRIGTAAERMGRDREITVLEARLAEVDAWTRRVRQLDALLGAKPPIDVKEFLVH
ncbi:hypothetical protein EW145_g6175 [Phellinidium pouzarii]|uniref:ABC transporter domain-containing protein n=1 Tax=Phellinidium pouzarii TaxID=167371 RepID=A0A4V6S139_9AGAM|nr:hypothetical protein EW145_g6175 [Phellinidium pouzarii]